MEQHLRTGKQEKKVNQVFDEEGTMLYEDTEVKDYKYLAGSPGEFIFVYTSMLNVISQWKLSYAAVCAYAYLLEKYASGVIFSMTATVRKDLAERSGKSPATFINVTRELLSLNLIVEVGYRSYKLNPKYAFKGKLADQKKAVFEILTICPEC